MQDIDPRGPLAREHRWNRRSVVTLRAVFVLTLILAPVAAVTLRGASDGMDDLLPGDEVVVADILGSQLPLHVNERVERWVERFRTDQRPDFQRLLARQGLYAEMIRQKLRDRGMPSELLYMAMMESGLSARAVSVASAVGVWQFMGPTAEQYGLRVDEFVDERRDPVRATDAALDYLQYLYERYDSWYLTAAAYNAGPGRVDRILRRHAGGRTGDEDLYWQVLEHLPRETREYVPRLVAATLLAENADAQGFEVDLHQPYRYERVFVPGGTSLSRVARGLGVEPRLLRDLNPHLIRGVTPPDETYPVRVPVGDSPRLLASMGRTGRSIRRADD
ncbi:MAG: lytic transglycosylase domain-containing protein [Longimicrobiales bacterium]